MSLLEQQFRRMATKGGARSKKGKEEASTAQGGADAAAADEAASESVDPNIDEVEAEAEVELDGDLEAQLAEREEAVQKLQSQVSGRVGAGLAWGAILR